MKMATMARSRTRRGELFWAALLVVNALISGATVNACYWIDGARALTLEDAANERR